MQNIMDYIAWRGDLPFAQDALNCVDALIFSRVAYLPFEGLWQPSENGKITLQAVYQRYAQRPGGAKDLLMPDDGKLLQALAASPRFQQVRLRDYRNIVDPVLEKQFAAVTLQAESFAFIAYRGTDNTLVGWKEDFNMSFSASVPAQAEAVRYLEQIAGQTAGPLYLGGHSKGGNLAVYAALMCPAALRRRIPAVFNNDGPGFSGDLLSGAAYREMQTRIHTFVPQSSVVGMLLEHEEDYVVVRSAQTGLMQHDLYSWEVLGPDFIRLKNVTKGSRFVDSTLKAWVAGMDMAQREAFIDAVFSVLEASGAPSFSELRESWPQSADRMLRALRAMEAGEKKQLLAGAVQLLRAAQTNLPGLSSADDAARLPPGK